MAVCTDCGIEFDPVPWADADDPICDHCINAILEEDYGDPRADPNGDGHGGFFA